MTSQHELTFISHRLDRRGGQERSTQEVLKRLVSQGHILHLVCFSIEDWDLSNHKGSVHLVPGKTIPIQLLKNLWFSIYTFILMMIRRPKKVLTIGTSSWWADVRLIQFLHKPYYQKVLSQQAVLPNATTPLKSVYQHFFARVTILIENILFRRTQSFIAISAIIKHELINAFMIDPEKVHIDIIHHAADMPISIDRKLPKKREMTKILFVGALERKGIEKALRVLHLCRDCDWHFDVVGAGDIIHWKDLALELGINERVVFHGVKPSSPFFDQAHIFLFPSTYEPFGLVVTEAISHQVFPLASLECGAMELWPTRDQRLKLSAQDPNEDWAFVLRELLQDQNFYSDQLKSAMDSMLQRTWDDVSDSYSKILALEDCHYVTSPL